MLQTAHTLWCAGGRQLRSVCAVCSIGHCSALTSGMSMTLPGATSLLLEKTLLFRLVTVLLDITPPLIYKDVSTSVCPQGLSVKVARAGSAPSISQEVLGGARVMATATTCSDTVSANSLPCADNRQVSGSMKVKCLVLLLKLCFSPSLYVFFSAMP